MRSVPSHQNTLTGAATKGRVDLDGTRQALEQLGLLHAAERLSELLSETVKQNLATHRFVEQLLAVELSQREERRIKTSLRLSGPPTGQTLANFDFAFQPSIEKSRIAAPTRTTFATRDVPWRALYRTTSPASVEWPT